MSLSTDERHQIENEVVFRHANESVAESLDELDTRLIDEGSPDLARDEDLQLEFMCECSDENCADRISMKLSEYEDIHKKRDLFVIKPDHEAATIETVVDKRPDYCVVEKKIVTSMPEDGLQETSIDNSN